MRYEKPIDLMAIGAVCAARPAFHRLRNQAVSLAIRALAASQKPYVAVSGGKDSVVTLAVAAEAARESGRELVAWAHVSDASFPQTEETIIEAGHVCGVPIHFDRSPISAFDVVQHGSAQKFGKQGYFFAAIRAWLEKGYDLCFTGVRAAESRRRALAAQYHGEIFTTTVPLPHTKCEPLTRWSIEDVAAGLHHYRLPIHPIYSKAAMSAVPIRLGYITAADWLKDQATFLRKNYPVQFARLANANPTVRNFT